MAGRRALASRPTCAKATARCRRGHGSGVHKSADHDVFLHRHAGEWPCHLKRPANTTLADRAGTEPGEALPLEQHLPRISRQIAIQQVEQVVLPAPLGPMTPRIPRAVPKKSRPQGLVSLKALERPWTSIMTPPAPRGFNGAVWWIGPADCQRRRALGQRHVRGGPASEQIAQLPEQPFPGIENHQHERHAKGNALNTGIRIPQRASRNSPSGIISAAPSGGPHLLPTPPTSATVKVSTMTKTPNVVGRRGHEQDGMHE